MFLLNFKIISFITLVFSIFFPTLSHAGSDSGMPLGEFELTVGTRPGVPYPALQNYNLSLTTHGSGSTFTVPVSRHHIIPFNVLRDFYNRVSSRGHLTGLRSFFLRYSQNLVHYADSAGVNCRLIGTDLIDAINLAEAQAYGLARGGGNRTVPGFDTFEQFYAWLPGNLFIGPNNRSDDPGAQFEHNALVVVGENSYAILARTYRNMQNYINGNDGALNSVAVGLTTIAARQSVYNLNSDDWEFVHGKYRLRGNNKPREVFKIKGNSTFLNNTCALHIPTLAAKLTVLGILK